MFYISVPDDFRFEHSLAFLRRSSAEVLHRCTDQSVRKALRFGDRTVLFEIRGPESGSSGIPVRVLIGRESHRLRTALADYIRRWFDLDRDLKPFLRLGRRDRLLGDLIRSYRGYRMVTVPDLFECLVWAVIGQQINLSFAYRLKQRFVERYGEALEYKGESYYLFPTPEIVAKIRPASLRALQFSRQKIDYTRNIARAFVSGEIDADRLSAAPFEEAHAALTAIKGVGNWTANYALMRSLGRPEGFPREDVGIHNALRARLGLDRKPTLAEVDAIFAKYRGQEAYASLYLWKSLGET